LFHARILGLAPSKARAYMVRTGDWKYVLYENFRPQFFDLRNDPKELVDLGTSPDHDQIRYELRKDLLSWSRRRRFARTPIWRCRDRPWRSSDPLHLTPPNRGSSSNSHLRGIRVPVEEPSTASIADTAQNGTLIGIGRAPDRRMSSRRPVD
jgi:hypothetical protein